MSSHTTAPGAAVRARWAALEGPPLHLVELPAADGGTDLLIYDEAGTLADVAFAPAGLPDTQL